MEEQALQLSARVEAVLVPKPPFSFDATVFKPSHFPTPDNYFEPGTYWQTLRFDDYLYGLKLQDIGSTGNPEILMSIYYDPSEKGIPDVNTIRNEVEYRFDMQSNLVPFVDELGADPILHPAITRWPGMRVSTPYSFYEFTVVTTVLQNTVVRRSVQMMQNLFETYGKRVRFDDKTLYGFWPPQTIANVEESDLRNLKLGYRAKTLKRQAADFNFGRVNASGWRSLEKDQLRSNLLKIYGIGPATVQYLLFEVFHHYDSCESIQPWEQKIYSRLLFDQELVGVPLIMQELDERWGRWKMLAMHYAFENLFWIRRNEQVPWLEALIKL